MHDRSRVHVRRSLCACIGCFDWRGNRTGTAVFFFPDVSVGHYSGHLTSSMGRHRSPFDDERKKGGKARDAGELSIR